MKFQSILFTLFAATQVASESCKKMAGGVVSNCGNNQDAFFLKNVKLMGKPARGSELKIQVDGVVRETINPGAKVTIKIKRQGRTLINITKDICELLVERKVGYKCPVKAQKISKTHVLKIPGYAPRGDYDIEASGVNKNNRRIFKVNIKATI
ncbi:Phosphatidylglycerol/phosphatidylinositol transfer protein [Entomophthora muscae]|uniref:Phosphatidylglycerol/phosphatidylinositol transfer protein n=1 Tax=Entomophthora muscae TaxID=34485 RepID=A0ACC2U7E4_9FUNG|nr:Phosphatidylglycerol/phosphatidylinositol transfer protein [Entomophthora muscae]